MSKYHLWRARRDRSNIKLRGVCVRSNFVIYTDSDGKMPILNPIGVPLSPSVAKHHRYWVEYRNDKPVKVRPYPSQTKVWDYSINKYVDINQAVLTLRGE